MSMNLYNLMLKSGCFDPRSEKYIWIRDMEWINPEDIEKYKEDIPDDAIPIAANGAGDIWVIKDNSIFLYCHDDEPMFYADSLINAVFRALLEYLSDNNFISKNENDENNAVYAEKYVAECINAFSDWFSAEQVSDLQKVLKNPISEYHYNNGTAYHSHISVEEADKIIRKYINYNYDADSAKSENNNISDEDINFSDCFSDEMIEQLRSHCRELSKIHLNSGVKFRDSIADANVLSTQLYKSSVNFLSLYRLGEIFTDGNFYLGKKMKEGSEAKGACREYFIDKNGKPIYAKLYADGNKKANYGLYFYFISDNSVVSVEYLCINDKNEYKYCYTTENTYDSDGKLLSFIKFDEANVKAAEYYIYENGKLMESICIEDFSYNENVGKIPDFLFPDEFANNPRRFSKNVYMYNDDVITGVHKTLCNDDGCKGYDFDVPKKIYSEVLKKGLI